MDILVEFVELQLAKMPRKKMLRGEVEFVHRYLGSSKIILGVKTADLVKIAKEAIKISNPATNWSDLLGHLFSACQLEDHIIGGKIYTFLKPEQRAQIPFSKLKEWLSKTKGWVEVDVICQSSFSGCEVLARLADWEKAICDFASSPNIQVRRASLVLQTRPVRQNDDKRLRQLAFSTIGQLKGEREVLITKPISWLLRSLAIQNPEETKEYIMSNNASLPKIAVREALKKIKTGKK